MGSHSQKNPRRAKTDRRIRKLANMIQLKSIVFSSLIILAGGQAEVGQQLEDVSNVDPSTYANSVWAELRAACPSGIDRCECLNAPGTYNDGNFDPDENFLTAMINMMGCSPGYCFCKDNPDKEVDVRPDYFKNVLDLCPRNELNRCLCEDGKTTERAPFDLLTILRCKPKKCKCNKSKKAKTNTGFGCRKGGWASCPKPTKAYCNDGTSLGDDYVMKWRTQTAAERWRLGDNFNTCICSDGMVPRCGGKGPEKPIQCPNGDEVDWALSVSQEFNGCQTEPDPVAAH